MSNAGGRPPLKTIGLSLRQVLNPRLSLALGWNWTLMKPCIDCPVWAAQMRLAAHILASIVKEGHLLDGDGKARLVADIPHAVADLLCGWGAQCEDCEEEELRVA